MKKLPVSLLLGTLFVGLISLLPNQASATHIPLLNTPVTRLPVEQTASISPSVPANSAHPPDSGTIKLRDILLNAPPPISTATALKKLTATGYRLSLVQFAGPVTDEYLQQLSHLKLDIVQYVPHNAYLVWGAADTPARLTAQIGIRWAGDYLPDYALAPMLRAIPANNTTPVSVTVQLYNHSQVQKTLTTVYAFATQIIQPDVSVGNYRNLQIQIPANQLVVLAAMPDVVNIEPWYPPGRLDEIQNRILAGQITDSLTSTIGYLDWLDSLNISTDPADYPIIDIVDDGVDNGTAYPNDSMFYRFGNPDNSSRLVYANNCTADAAHGIDGHGHLNANIAAGYNAQTGPPHVDAGGFQRGQGVNPYGRVASTRIFNDSGSYDISRCSSDSVLAKNSYNSGARISSNSWGQIPGSGVYNVSAQTYDTLTRDALPDTPGNQEMIFVFSAGNSGPAANTISYPATAKNVLTVGASESLRDDGIVDGCGYANNNSINDIASFSARGPTDDGRFGLDTIAPGVHIQGTTPVTGFTGAGVCGAPGSRYYPAGQTTYTWSSGTSHAAPAIAGATSLTWYWLKNRFTLPQASGAPNPASSGDAPSPAMIAAYIAAHARYLTGSGAGGNLPGNSQGLGAYDMGMAFDSARRILIDQNYVFDQTGQVFTLTDVVADPAQPFRVALAWTDAPGATIGSAYVNNLDLEMIINGQTYRGNNFSGDQSQPGGIADFRNNTEAIFLPAGQAGPFTLRVVAANIPGDGVPNTGDSTDQDFALVCYNCGGKEVKLYKSASADTVEPGQTLTYTLTALNNTDDLLTGVIITDTLPGGTAFVNASTGGLLANGIVTWPDQTIPQNTLLKVTVTVQAGYLPHGSLIANNQYGLISTEGIRVTGNTVNTLVQWPYAAHGCSAEETVIWRDDHEDGNAGWLTDNAIGNNSWLFKTDGGFSGNSYWFVADVGGVTDSRLDSPLITVTAASPVLHFYHHYNFEYLGSNYYDGGVIEISRNNGPFADVEAGRFTQNGYNGTISTGFSNPLGGRTAFVGDVFGGVYHQSSIDLGDLLEMGDQFRVRFRQANDFSVGAGGWTLDDMWLTGCSADRPALTISKTASPSPTSPGDQITYTLSVTNNGTTTATAFITDSIPAHTAFAAAEPPGVLVDTIIGWGFADIPAGETLTRTVVVTIDPDFTGAAIINHLYGVTSTQGVGNLGLPVTASITKIISVTPKIYLPLIVVNSEPMSPRIYLPLVANNPIPVNLKIYLPLMIKD